MKALHTTIVSVDDLAAHPEWRVFDCSHAIGDADAGARAYAEGHIPGALHARMEGVLSGPRSGNNGRNPLPTAQEFADWLGSAGLQSVDQVVVYDRSGNAAATRMWWMLRWIGHKAVAVLDGGLAAWTAAGHRLSTETKAPNPTKYTPLPDDALHVDVDFIARNLGKTDVLMIDARGGDKFAGINETTDPRGGHVPGAINRPYTQNVTAEGLFKSAEQLRAELQTLIEGRSGDQIIAQCGSGVSACHNILAMEIAGISGVRLYPGSWSEWCADPTRPIET